MKTIKIKNINTDETIEMKPYLIGDIPPSFDKNKDIHFNRGGITSVSYTHLTLPTSDLV